MDEGDLDGRGTLDGGRPEDLHAAAPLLEALEEIQVFPGVGPELLDDRRLKQGELPAALIFHVLQPLPALVFIQPGDLDGVRRGPDDALLAGLLEDDLDGEADGLGAFRRKLPGLHGADEMHRPDRAERALVAVVRTGLGDDLLGGLRPGEGAGGQQTGHGREKTDQCRRSDHDSWRNRVRLAGGPKVRNGKIPYSHSMVAGGLELTSKTTRLTPRTSLVMRLEMCCSRS